jgi:hypothetical protein
MWTPSRLALGASLLRGRRRSRESLLAPWTEAARHATAALPDRGALPFQHATFKMRGYREW